MGHKRITYEWATNEWVGEGGIEFKINYEI
jgi:hypothetical protein